MRENMAQFKERRKKVGKENEQWNDFYEILK
jgi:hypothetical protein